MTLRFEYVIKDAQFIYFDCLTGNRWRNHGQPPGANVAAVVDAASFRPEVIFTVRYSEILAYSNFFIKIILYVLNLGSEMLL